MAKIAISLPDEVLEAIERERKVRGETRSEFLRGAVEAYFRRERERRAVEQYVGGYQQQPESEEEVALMEAATPLALSESVWEDGEER